VADPWALLVTNVGTSNTTITIEQNNAEFGSPPSLAITTTAQLAPGEVRQFDMPTREVTGWTPSTPDPPGPPMTHLSSAAFRIRSSQPIVIVQINNTSGFSTDASLLIPRDAFGTSYRVIGWPAANPVSVYPMESVPDHSSITVVAVEQDTQVTLTVAGAVLGDGNTIDDTPANGTVTVHLGAFDVLNLASNGAPGDLSGSLVSATKPVAVFSSSERALVPAATTVGFPYPPGTTQTDICCTDHVEEQLFPVSALGKRFVLPHSPWRSTGGFKEADFIRFVGGMSPALVTTNLPAPHASFTLQPGMVHDAFTTGETHIEATTPILVAQVLASALAVTPSIGDPSLTVVPPIDHHRERYPFLVPQGWTLTHVSLAAPVGTALQLDGVALAGCETAPIGSVGSVLFEAHRAPLQRERTHSTAPRRSGCSCTATARLALSLTLLRGCKSRSSGPLLFYSLRMLGPHPCPSPHSVVPPSLPFPPQCGPPSLALPPTLWPPIPGPSPHTVGGRVQRLLDGF